MADKKRKSRKKRTPTVRRTPSANDVVEISGSRPLSRGSPPPPCLAVDLGQLDSPIRGWNDLETLLASDVVDLIHGRISAGKEVIVAAKYRRREIPGVLALVVSPGTPPAVSAMASASRDLEVLAIRSGSSTSIMRGKSTAIVGLGAVGSFTADLLARSGIGYLRLVDGEILRPGNVVRHLGLQQQVGMYKVDVVKERVLDLGFHSPDAIQTHPHRLTSLEEAATLVAAVDVVIDASGSGPTLALLSAAIGDGTGAPLLTVGVFREGGLIRVDRLPLAAGEVYLPDIPFQPSSNGVMLESGCGDPVSPTPPHAVVIAASLVTRVAIRALMSQTVPPTLIQVLESQSDPPYQAEGLLR